jgi:predicted secreted Zn-dependent protease
MLHKTAFIVALATLMTSQGAAAGVSQHSTYDYFEVDGNSPAAIYNAVTAQSQANGLYSTLATTAVEMQPHINLAPKPRCHVSKVDIALTFHIRLPRLNAGTLSARPVRKDWAGFVAHLQHHEEHHRGLWMACARNYEKASRKLSAQDCGTLVTEAKTAWSKIDTICQSGNTGFDIEEERRLSSFRFIRRAFNSPAR